MVAVHVDDLGLKGDGLNDLVSVAGSWQARADVEELPDSLAAGQVADRAG
jgi:hypothetical protein